MDLQEFYPRFIAALVIGLVLGIERGWKQRDEVAGEREAGIRTFTLVSLTGFAAGLGASTLGSMFPAMVGAGVLALVVVSYYTATARQDADRGMTTEVAVFLTYVLGVLCAMGVMTEAAIIAVIAVALLDQKPMLHGFLQQVQRLELVAGLKLLLVAVILLPVLPDQGFGPGNLLNPRELCWAVVVTASMGLAGYAAIKVAGPERGALFMGLFGGLVSSTSVTVSAARAARDAAPAALPLAAAVSLAQTVMFARTTALVYAMNVDLFGRLVVPLALGGLVALAAAALITLRARQGDSDARIAPTSADTLGAALRFVVLVATLLVVSHYAREQAGSLGILVGSLISGAIDVDAATVSASRLTSAAVDATTPLEAGAMAIALAILANSLVKSGIAFSLGTRPMAWPAAAGLVASGAASLAAVALA